MNVSNRWMCLAFLLPGLASAQPGADPVLVEVATAQRDEVAATSWVPGTVVSRNDARVAAEITGRLTWVAEVGDLVESGGPLAIIEDRELQLELRNSEASVKRLQAQLRYQESQIQRLERLARSDNAAATQLDEARANGEMTAQDLAAAQVARERIQYRLSRTRVTAPFGGMVVSRLTQPGEYVNAGTAVARLVDTEHKEVRAQAPLSTARYIDAGLRVAVEDDTLSEKNPIRTVIPVGDERSRMIEVRVALEQTDWVIGGAVRVALPTSETRELVAIPRDALVLRGRETFVYRVDEGGNAERIDVRTGIGLGTMVEVIGGIQPGDRLIVRGGERLRPGQAVTVSEGNS